MQVGLLRALDTWLAEDHTRVEHRLVAREAVAQLVELVAAACRGRDMVTMPQMLDTLKLMLGRCAAGAGGRGSLQGPRAGALVPGPARRARPPAPGWTFGGASGVRRARAAALLPPSLRGSRERRCLTPGSPRSQVVQAVRRDGHRRARAAAAGAPCVAARRRRAHSARAPARNPPGAVRALPAAQGVHHEVQDTGLRGAASSRARLSSCPPSGLHPRESARLNRKGLCPRSPFLTAASVGRRPSHRQAARGGPKLTLPPLPWRPAPPRQDVLRRLLESEGRGEDAVKLEAQKLLAAFHINVLL
jgi:hypothetical protein